MAFDAKEDKSKFWSDHLSFNSKESLQSKSWPWKLEIERGERTNLVWFGRSKAVFLFFYWLAADSVIAKIISSRLKDVQTRLNWKLES